ncbi:hypothetical protein C8R43DRAFT_1139829 [Mycena crocata]|nr:hypothetical protein C8R43DRAFT_1139829 [Mycena crocata]
MRALCTPYQRRLDTLFIQSNIALRRGDAHELISIAHDARKIGTFIPIFAEATWTDNEALANCMLGNLSQALALSKQAQELVVATGFEGSDRHLGVLDTQAAIHLRKSDYIQSRKLHEEVASMTSPTRSPFFHANALYNLAHIGILTARPENDILSNLNVAEEMYVALGSQRFLMCRWIAAESDAYRGDTEAARVAFERCLSKSRGVYTDVEELCLSSLAEPRYKMYGPEETFRWGVVHLAFSWKLKDCVATFNTLRRLGNVYAELNDDQTALALFQTAMQGATEIGIPPLRAECTVGIGHLMERRHELLQAKALLQAAHPLYITSSRWNDAVAVQERLDRLGSV